MIINRYVDDVKNPLVCAPKVGSFVMTAKNPLLNHSPVHGLLKFKVSRTYIEYVS